MGIPRKKTKLFQLSRLSSPAICEPMYYKQRPAPSKLLRHKIPVDKIPEISHILGSGVLLVQIVGMLPHVDDQNRLVAIGKRVAGIGFLNDFKMTFLVFHQPAPSAAKQRNRLGGKFLLKLVETAEITLIGIKQFAFRLCLGMSRQAIPIKVWLNT